MSMQAQSHPAEPQGLVAYLEGRVRTTSDPPDLARRITRMLVPRSGRPPLRRLLTRAIAPYARRRAATLASGSAALCLNLGSATSHLPGWVNVDLVGDGADLPWDLTRQLPFRDGAVAAIFSEHVLEHFELAGAIALLRESHRLLSAGGIVRIGVPDAGAHLRAYCDPDSEFLQTIRPGRPTRMLAVQEVFRDDDHRSAYDFDTLELLLHTVGFHSVKQQAFGESQLNPCPDGRHRRLGTLYVEALR
jgi:SAM-dependent methyltransferase